MRQISRILASKVLTFMDNEHLFPTIDVIQLISSISVLTVVGFGPAEKLKRANDLNLEITRLGRE